MKYAIITESDYIIGLCQSENNMVNEVTEKMFNIVSATLLTKPHDAPNGYDYKLRTDTLKWELVEIEEEPIDKSESEDKEKLYKTFTKEQLEIVKNSKFLSEIFDLG